MTEAERGRERTSEVAAVSLSCEVELRDLGRTQVTFLMQICHAEWNFSLLPESVGGQWAGQAEG